MEDVFDDTCEFDTHPWHARVQETHVNAGYREGLAAGQEVTLQQGFNAGYCDVIVTSFTLAHLRGVLTALLGVHLTGGEEVQDLLKHKLSGISEKKLGNEERLSGTTDKLSDNEEKLPSQNTHASEIKSGDKGKAIQIRATKASLKDDKGGTNVYETSLVNEIEDMIQRLSEAEESLKVPPVTSDSIKTFQADKVLESTNPELPLQQLQTVVNLQQIMQTGVNRADPVETAGRSEGKKSKCCGEESDDCCQSDKRSGQGEDSDKMEHIPCKSGCSCSNKTESTDISDSCQDSAGNTTGIEISKGSQTEKEHDITENEGRPNATLGAEVRKAMEDAKSLIVNLGMAEALTGIVL